MEFQSLHEETIREFLDQSGSPWYVLTLTDGMSLPFKVESEDILSRPGYLKSVSLFTPWGNKVIFIPLNRIAGLNTFNFKQKLKIIELFRLETPTRDDEADYVINSYGKNFLDFLIENADAMGFLIEDDYRVHYCLSNIITRIEYTDLILSDETPLYSDWGYMQRISGGLNSIGVGIPFASISAGWNKSLMAFFKNKVRESTKALDKICSNKEAAVNGFITLINKNTNSDGKYPKEKAGLQMEGANWVPAAISSQRPYSPDDLAQIGWHLIYFRDDGFMIPQEFWEIIRQPVRVFGEILPVKMKTSMGDQACYLKARAAAYVGVE